MAKLDVPGWSRPEATFLSMVMCVIAILCYIVFRLNILSTEVRMLSRISPRASQGNLLKDEKTGLGLVVSEQDAQPPPPECPVVGVGALPPVDVCSIDSGACDDQLPTRSSDSAGECLVLDSAGECLVLDSADKEDGIELAIEHAEQKEESLLILELNI